MDQITDAVTQTDETLEPTVTQENLPETDNSVAEKDPLGELISKRMGAFEIKITPADLKYIRNSMQSKIEWKGPNEAYLVIMAILTLNNALEGMDTSKTGINAPVAIKLPSSTIESVSFFLNRITGTGLDSAQRLFGISMILRPSVEAIRKLDEEIEHLQKQLTPTPEGKN